MLLMTVKKRLVLCLLAVLIGIATLSVCVSAEESYKIVVNKSTNCVTVYKKVNGNYEPFKAMLCSVGANNATPSGSFKTSDKYRWHPLFGNVYGQYVTRINGNILFHSVYYSSQNAATLQTKEFNKLGTAASAGCVRLNVRDTKWIYDNCSPGTQVDIVNSGNDPLPKPVGIKLGASAKYPHWDPTDPDPANPWSKESVVIVVKNSVKRVKADYAMDLSSVLRDGVTAYDIAGNEIHYDISCNISKTTPGEYPVRYFATDAIGNYLETTAKLIIE